MGNKEKRIHSMIRRIKGPLFKDTFQKEAHKVQTGVLHSMILKKKNSQLQTTLNTFGLGVAI